MDQRQIRSVIISDGDALDRFIKTDNTHLLPSLCDRFVIPEQVYREITHPETPEKVREWVKQHAHEESWLKVAKDPLINPNPEKSGGWGEKQAIALASQYQKSNQYESVSILLEDRRGIARAERESLRVDRGLLLLEEADRMGLIKSLPREIERLEEIPIDYRNETMKVGDRIMPATEVLRQRHHERQELIRQLPITSVPSNLPNRRDFIASFPSGHNARFSVGGLLEGDNVRDLMSFNSYEQLRQQNPGEVMNLSVSTTTLSHGHGETHSQANAQTQTQTQTQTHSIKF